MASRILFENDIADQTHNKVDGQESNINMPIKEENITDEDNYDQENNSLSAGQLCSSVNNNDCRQPMEFEKILNPVQENTRKDCSIDTAATPCSSSSYDIQINQNDKHQDENVMVKICPSLVDGDGKSNKPKGKKKPSELELLGVDIKKINEDSDNEYDVYGDDSKIFRKYKLRKTELQISYKEPTDWKPKRRVSSDDEPKSLICPVCEREFESSRALQSHVRCHENTVKEYTCSLCSEKFNKNADLIAHKSTHNSESFLCKQCKLAFSDHCDYLLHNFTHTTQSHLTCPECGLRYRRNSYKIHIVTHFDKKVTCPICSFVTNGEYNLQCHLNQHNYKLTCVECGKICKDKSYYKYHMSVHTGVKKCQCLYCGKCFRTHNMLRVHTRIHTGEKPYTCDICGHKATQSGDMKRHKVTHETVKQFTCDVCDKKFFHKESLVNHRRCHTNTCLYECPQCDGKFITAAGLTVHTMYKHLSERPVECSCCDKKFINHNQYRKHTRSKNHKRNAYGQLMKQEKA